MSTKSVLVTGCAGFIGSTLSERLLADGYEVIGIDCFTNNYSRWIKERNLLGLRLHPRFTFLEQHLLHTDRDLLLDKVNYVFHLAALPGVRTSWGAHFQEYVDHNILATQGLLEALRRHTHVEKVVYASSSSVYGGMTGPADEFRVPTPLSPYGVTKLSGEQLCLLYGHHYGIPIVAMRYFTVFGPRQRPDMAFHIFIKRILEGQPLTIFGDGGQTRDFTFIKDCVDANIAAMLSPVQGEAFNIGGVSHLSVLEVVRLIEKATGKQANLLWLPEVPGDPKHTFADIGKAQALLHYNPQFDVEHGLRLQIDDVKRLYNL
ncbi:NAD-dependent epimerase/dehydratase family protein [Tumebacillus sp. ITR2]|uniref:NAD-dependent epimerase/dehydratase family protein n=1 Tax=Tumebacillus amylolyticus TaxID=2801339 RepID=A0ABS1JF65_9BACL|nr:NAD-dependent epimerase/dehydratase family protein [Tumebacillus amylolyticus]MBL0388639.1 NAD-dependent epimerase/dehydratase family protein [Tumebacillus amylolyticus]